MVVAIVAAALATAITSPSVLPPRELPNADPAIWVVNDEDTTIFLFGTFHALDGRSEWFTEEVRTAFSASEELVLETVIPEFGRGSTAPSAPGGPTSRGQGSGAFAGATRLAISAGRAQGLSVDRGADAVLRRVAEATGKRVGGLETIEFQIGMFDRMAAATRGPTPTPHTGTSHAKVGKLMNQMQGAWKRGEQGLFVVLLNHMRASAPDAYQTMFAERNVHWAGWIAQRLKEPGTVFVAVGAGHLAGRDSVQAKLAQLGVKSARIN